jgi:hypothetical protein
MSVKHYLVLHMIMIYEPVCLQSTLGLRSKRSLRVEYLQPMSSEIDNVTLKMLTVYQPLRPARMDFFRTQTDPIPVYRSRPLQEAAVPPRCKSPRSSACYPPRPIMVNPRVNRHHGVPRRPANRRSPTPPRCANTRNLASLVRPHQPQHHPMVLQAPPSPRRQRPSLPRHRAAASYREIGRCRGRYWAIFPRPRDQLCGCADCAVGCAAEKGVGSVSGVA